MTRDTLTLRAAAIEADARCNTARKNAEEAQCAAASCPCVKHATAHERALGHFWDAMAVRDRCRRAWKVAEESMRESA